MGTGKRQSKYTEELAEYICEQLAKGRSLHSICKDDGMPGDSTVRWWMQEKPEFAANSARAREMGCDRLAEECLEIADTPKIGEERTIKPDGAVEVREGDMLQHRRLQIETRIRLIGKWSKRYGDKVAIGGTDELPAIKVDGELKLTPSEAYKRMLEGK